VKPTLALCMIVKNEEVFLRSCLESIKDVVDEMVIVDTGSTDGTVEIARGFPASIYFHEWQDSFSEARNYALKYVTSDWVIQLDADEEFVTEDTDLLRAVLEHAHDRPEIGAIYTLILNRLTDSQWSKHYFQRIYRKGSHYEGIVHNQLQHEGGILESNIRIRHYGYALDAGRMEAKAKRTGDLLRKQLEENPANTFAQMNLVRILRNRSNWPETIETAETFLREYGQRMPSMHRQMIMNDLAFCLVTVDRVDDAASVCAKVLGENPGNLDVLFSMGVICLKRSDCLTAIGNFKQFVKAKHQQDVSGHVIPLIVDTYTADDKVWNNIGECFKRMNRWGQALPCYAEAVRLNPDEAMYYKGAHVAYLALGDVSKAYSALRKAREVGVADDEVEAGIAQMETEYDIEEVPDDDTVGTA